MKSEAVEFLNWDVSNRANLASSAEIVEHKLD
jgi:hypothetical protein